MKSEGCPKKLERVLTNESEDGLFPIFYVYLIKSLSLPNIFYAGYTTNLKQRLRTHNAGKSIHTSKATPWELIMYCGFTEKLKAQQFEIYLKSQSGRAFAKKRFL